MMPKKSLRSHLKLEFLARECLHLQVSRLVRSLVSLLVFLAGLLHFFSSLKESLECLECLAILAHAKLGTVIVWVPPFCSTDGTLTFSSGKM